LLRDVEAGPFYFAETNHRQYLAKNSHGYCGIGGTVVERTIGTSVGA
jgi:peptide-methionine (S)-S-oxide reductase